MINSKKLFNNQSLTWIPTFWSYPHWSPHLSISPTWTVPLDQSKPTIFYSHLRCSWNHQSRFLSSSHKFIHCSWRLATTMCSMPPLKSPVGKGSLCLRCCPLLLKPSYFLCGVGWTGCSGPKPSAFQFRGSTWSKLKQSCWGKCCCTLSWRKFSPVQRKSDQNRTLSTSNVQPQTLHTPQPPN